MKTTARIRPLAEQKTARLALVLPVLAQAARRAPTMRAWVNAFPRVFRKHKRVMALAFALFFVPFFGGLFATLAHPDFAFRVAEDVAAGRAERGILVCGSGIGMAISANKVPGIRAANINSEYEAQMSREHNDLNVLTLGARILDEAGAKEIVQIWLETPFSGGRHTGRLEKIHDIEKARS